jgi:type I restriction enzyme S subunit
MTPETFFANFGHLAEAPNGVQKLRELILSLAVRGKLVPQDHLDDEPVSNLLQKIKRERLVTPAKGLLPIVASDCAYELPHSWEWVRLRQVADFNIGRTPSTKTSEYWSDNGVPWVSIADMEHYGRISSTKKAVSDKAIKEVFRANPVPAGTILMSFKLTIGKVSLLEVDAYHNEAIISVFPAFTETRDYFFRVLPLTAVVGNTNNAIKGQTLNSESLTNLLIPFPPLAEQHRIVAKVDQLMALCDELEERQLHSRAKLTRLNNAALDRLLTSRDADTFTAAWSLVRDNFELLYTTPETIAKLRQAILQLAVQGKLVPQDPNDEPASVLLERIKVEKERLLKEKKIRKADMLPLVSADEAPYELPSGWKWVRLENLCEVITKGSSPKWQGVNYVGSDKGVLFVTSENVGSFCLRLEEPKYVEAKFNEIEPRSILRKNDVLMNIVGASIGRTAIFDIDDIANINQAVCMIRFVAPNSHVDLRFMLYFFNSSTCVGYMFDKQVDNARANLSMGNIAKFAIPLPPFAEQHRIVAKVDQLMALCDELEAKLAKSQTKAEKLVTAAVKGLLAA